MDPINLKLLRSPSFESLISVHQNAVTLSSKNIDQWFSTEGTHDDLK